MDRIGLWWLDQPGFLDGAAFTLTVSTLFVAVVLGVAVGEDLEFWVHWILQSRVRRYCFHSAA